MRNSVELPPILAAISTCLGDFCVIQIKLALRELYKAYVMSACSAFDPWELAVEFLRLRALGISETDLRWLVRSGYVDHACEVTDILEDGRTFVPTGNLSFADRTCFVLTVAGASFAQVLLDCGTIGAPFPNSVSAAHVGCGCNTAVWEAITGVGSYAGPRVGDDRGNGDKNGHAISELIPLWDPQRHELRVGDRLVKRFKGAAINQETILSAFQEDGWPPRIDDPLPPLAEQDCKRRLNDTIKCLNKNQQHKLICFHGDGTGEGILWNFAKCNGSLTQ